MNPLIDHVEVAATVEALDPPEPSGRNGAAGVEDEALEPEAGESEAEGVDQGPER